MKKTYIILILLMVLSPFCLLSQTDNAQQELEEVQLLSRLSEEHNFLHQMEGIWKVSGINYSANNEIPVKGRANVTKIMNGHYIDFTFSLENMSGYSDTKMLIGYDSRYSVFSLYIIDDILNYATIATGVKTGDKLVFSGKNKFIFFDSEVDFRIEIERMKENKIIYQLFYLEEGKETRMLKYQLIKQ